MVGCETDPIADGFDDLADLIASNPTIARSTHFVIVPGPTDLTSNAILPRRPIMTSFTQKLRSKVPNIHFSTNPCRIKFCDQEVVVFREDLMARMLRNLVGVKPDVREDDLKRYVRTFPPLSPYSLLIAPAASAVDPGPKSSCTAIQCNTPHSFGARPQPAFVPIAYHRTFTYICDHI